MAVEDGKSGGLSIDPRTAALGAEAGSLPLPVGTVLERGFVIRSVLGRGGFGITYMAEHTGLGRRVALKEHFPEQFSVRQGLSVRPTSAGAAMFKWGLDRFLEEAKRLAQFKHPSVVDVSDVFEANGTAYMALAYEDGETLGQWLAAWVARRRKLSWTASSPPSSTRWSTCTATTSSTATSPPTISCSAATARRC